MRKNILIIFLLITFFTIFISTAENNSKIPAEDRGNFEITKYIQSFLGKIYSFVFGGQKKNDENKTNNVNNRSLENNNLFEGDIMLTEEQADDIVDKVVEKGAEDGIDISKVLENETDVRLKRKLVASRSNWQFPIQFWVRNNNGKVIRNAIKKIEQKTCITFEEIFWQPFGKPGLQFINGPACYSFVGKIYNDKFQDVSIPAGCDTLGKVQHEIMHALGSEHEQCRTDRDKYLTIIPENVKRGMMVNYDKIQANDSKTFGIKYEYGSNMHYRARAFGINDMITMLPKDGLYNKTIGHLGGLTFLDTKLLNLQYCSHICKDNMKCYNGGYQNPKRCGYCKCVRGYGGRKCTKIQENINKCGQQLYFVNSTQQNINVIGESKCLYHLKANYGKKIKIDVTYLFGFLLNERYTCDKKDAVEIKYYKDKTLTGALICQTMGNVSIVTENNHAIIHVRSAEDFNKINMTFSLY
ncbi:Astacin-like metalloendopeptidase [Strongyloides ratti]|uniref:Zinc metalloproteinase n=1 Tax=Strongyloides ratti TaxID=34506 RepID=A0A090LKJ0_STRRB|nr:Astacin-like metalloendopeptidase [Strongyloides ratti]CEF70193.1 Astacin-like metalloendopeptidase [Strongyloides ratti]